MAKRPAGKTCGNHSAEIDASLDLENLVGYNLRRAHAVQRQRFASVFGPEGIRPVLLSALGLIYETPKLRQSDLGKLLEVKRANVVTMLDELEQRGLIERRRSNRGSARPRDRAYPSGSGADAPLAEDACPARGGPGREPRLP